MQCVPLLLSNREGMATTLNALWHTQHYTVRAVQMEGQEADHADDFMAISTDIFMLNSLTCVQFTAVKNLSPICNWSRLVNLFVSQLLEPASLPASITNLAQLQRLSLDDVSLGVNWQSLPFLTALTHLWLKAHVYSSSMPSVAAGLFQGLASLPVIRSLTLLLPSHADNRWSALGRLSTLQDLTISAQLTALECSSAWQNLTELELKSNMLESMPSNLTCLTGLRVLDMSNQQHGHFQLTSPLTFLSCLKQLKYMVLSQQSIESDADPWDTDSLCYLGQAMRLAGKGLTIKF